MPTVREIEQILFDWAPRELAAEWDNVGLLVGNPSHEVARVLVALDITEGVAAEAIERGADLIVAHHPVMNCTWHKVQSVRTDDRQGRILTTLLRHDIAAICMHTNLDAAEGGVNDALAAALGLSRVESFNDEKIGRIGVTNCEIPLEQFLPHVVKSLGCGGIRYLDAKRPVHKVAVGGGACGSEIGAVLAAGCDTFVTSDLRYNDFLDTQGLNLIDAGHFPTEDVICPVIVSFLAEHFPGVETVRSTSHKEVIQYYT